jgi:hypothetical protein
MPLFNGMVATAWIENGEVSMRVLNVIAGVALMSASATSQAQEQRVTLQLPDIEKVSELVHADWVDKRLAEGVTSRLSTWGEELVRPYNELSDRAKQLDRNTVEVVYKAIREAAK